MFNNYGEDGEALMNDNDYEFDTMATYFVNRNNTLEEDLKLENRKLVN